MKVVHINTNDLGGGAAIAASRHCEAMRMAGIEAKLITLSKGSHYPYVKKIHLGLRTLLAQLFVLLSNRKIKQLNPTGTFSVMRYGHPFHKDKDVREADAIVIHWVNKNCISIKEIENILKLGKPTVWYMHDMFPITGGCHHSLGCDGYTIDCKDCPLIKGKGCNGVAAKQLKKKLRHWKKYQNLMFATPSNWLASCVRKSALAQGHEVKVIPNTINTDLFKPLPFDCKVLFGLDPNKKTILFSADLSGSVYKGSQYTIDCLKKLEPEKYEGLIIGNMPKGLEEQVSIKVTAMGYLTDQLSLVLAYNACDTVLITSIAENYPNVILEAMSCGKPCMGFKVGGIPDLIKEGETGYITEVGDVKGLVDGIQNLQSSEKYKRLACAAREQVLKNNSYKVISKAFVEVLR